MPITKPEKRELDQMVSDLRAKYGGCKEDYFACLYLTKKFECEVTDIARQCSFGNNDYGIDAYYIDRGTKNLYLFQFKWSENHNLFKESLDRLAKNGIERVFGNPLADPAQNDLLINLKTDLDENKFLIKRVMIQMVFKGDLDAAENSEGLRDRRENLENKRHLVQGFFNDPEMELRVEFVTDHRLPPPPPEKDSFKITFTNTASITTTDGLKTMYVGFVPLMDLLRVHRSLGQKFLDRNIRSGLSSDNPPNAKIREALGDIVLRQRMSPDLFPFNHNGVTLNSSTKYRKCLTRPSPSDRSDFRCRRPSAPVAI
jgi:hypothetical protein